MCGQVAIVNLSARNHAKITKTLNLLFVRLSGLTVLSACVVVIISSTLAVHPNCDYSSHLVNLTLVWCSGVRYMCYVIRYQKSIAGHKKGFECWWCQSIFSSERSFLHLVLKGMNALFVGPHRLLHCVRSVCVQVRAANCEITGSESFEVRRECWTVAASLLLWWPLPIIVVLVHCLIQPSSSTNCGKRKEFLVIIWFSRFDFWYCR